MTKAKVAMELAGGIAGCEMSVLDTDERLIQIIGENGTHFNPHY